MKKHSVILGGLVLLVSACAPQAPPVDLVDLDAERAALLDRDHAWSETLPDDLDAFLSFFAEDGGFYPSEAPIAVGTDAIRAVMSGVISTPGIAFNWTATKADVSQAGDLGYTTGTYDQTVHDAAGNPVMTQGKYVIVWKKQEDGQWKVVADIANPDAPPSVPEG